MEPSSSGGRVGTTSDGPKMDLGFAQVKLKPFRYRWTIQNFKSFYDEKKTVESPLFSPSGNEDDDLCLRVRPSTSSPDEHLSLFLVNNSESKISVKFKVALIDSEGERGYQKGNEVFYDIDVGRHQGWEEFIRWEDIFQESEGSGLLVNDELEIICSGAIFDGFFCPSNLAEMSQFEKNQESQQGNGLDYQSSGLGRFFDVTLLVGRIRYQCHKSVLAAGSPVFATMLEHNLKTQQRSRLEVTDVDDKVLEKLLEYFYTGKVAGIEKMAEKLLPAADKYEVLDLKVMCEEEIASKLSVKNAVRILLLAHRYSSKELKAEAVELICCNSLQVLQTAAWKELGKSNPELIAETFEALAIAHEAEIGVGLPSSGRFNNQIQNVTASRETIANNSKWNWRCAHVKVKSFSYMWTIKDFTSLYEDKRTLESPTFSVPGNEGNAEFRLLVQPSAESPTDYLSLFIKNCAESKSNQYITYEFAMIDSNGEKVFYVRVAPDYDRVGTMGGRVGWTDYIRWEKIFKESKSLLVNDQLKILCNGEIFDGSIPSEPGEVNTIQLQREFQVNKDFTDLLESGRFSDVTLVVGKEEFAAHKLVLATGSSVFSKMFEQNSGKGQSGKGDRLEITDVEADILRDLLKFIYTGKMKDIVKVAEKLLPAAEKYGVDNLKVICEEEILSKLSVINAARIYLLGYLHSSKELKAEALKLICRCPKQVSQTEGWKSLAKSNPELIVEAFEALAIAHQEENLTVC